MKALHGAAVLALWAMLNAHPVGAQANLPETRERAVMLAREGKLVEALIILERLRKDAPNDQAVAQDYLVILGWAGRDRDAIEVFATLNRDQLPDYVIEGAARSARNVGSYQQAVDLYRYGQRRWPDQSGFAAGEVYALVEAGQGDAAVARAQEFSRKWPDDIAIMGALARAFQAQDRFADSLAVTTKALSVKPDDRDALRLHVLALNEIGSPEVALLFARKYPGLISEAERQRIEANVTAYRIRSAQDVRPATPAQRFSATDRALSDLRQRIAQYADDPSARPALLNARYDLVVALRDRYLMQEALKEYRRILAEGEHPPAYVQRAAADALLYLRRPAEAVSVYRSVLESDSDDFDARLSLSYALAETGQFDEAIATIDALTEEQPIWLTTVEGRSLLENPRRLSAEQARAAIRLYADDISGAQALFTELAERAPRNSVGYQGLGEVYLARGLPRNARAQFEQGLAVERANRDQRGNLWPTYGLEVGRAAALIDTRQYALAKQEVANVSAAYPEQQSVQQLVRRWDIHNKRELQADVRFGTSDSAGTQTGERSLELNSRFFTSPIADNYRAFAGYRLAQAKFDPMTQTLHRGFAGLEYRGGDWELTGEASYNEYGESDAGARLAMLWETDDHFSLGGNVQIFSEDTPLRALADGTTANSARLEGSYRIDNRMGLVVGGQVVDFSDDNFRSQGDVAFETRAFTRPFLKIDAGLAFSVSGNDRTDVSYFSPSLDSEQAASLSFAHTLYQRYETSYSHKLTLNGGNYWQEDFGSALIGGALYEHQLSLNDLLDLSVGLGYDHRVYDGDEEEQLALIARLGWKF